MSSEEKSSERSSKVFWRDLAVRYWVYVVIFGVIGIGAIIGFILTLDWYINTSPVGGKGTWTFNQFSMGTGLEFAIFLFLYMLVIVGVPTLAAAGIVTGLLWFVIFDTELKEEIKLRNKKDEERRKKFGKTSEGGGIFGFLMFVGVCIYITLDGHWMTEFGSLNFRYFVDAWIAVFLWVLVIFCIGGGLGIIWFVKKYEPSANQAS
ncbi:hypothetical protein CEE45_15935 [Candidatus Heimdallarchaeota archaeon B3_Heim]|nr:MAG: hypothetical protein CEE45_15935 [Candidatus Heimdallarchaeota archaeon B3_Heim]